MKTTPESDSTSGTTHKNSKSDKLTVSVGRPNYIQVLKYARIAIGDEAKKPSGWSYDRQTVEHDILNHFDGLTNSDADYEFIVEAIREAENEYNEANDCGL